MKLTRLTIPMLLALSACHNQADTAPAGNAAMNTSPAAGHVAGNPDMSPLVAEVDTNHDGKMSRAEWQAAGLPMSSFNMFEKGRGYVTQADYDSNPAPKGIDINGDGKVTVAEFKQFDKMMSAKMGPKMGAGAPPPPASTVKP